MARRLKRSRRKDHRRRAHIDRGGRAFLPLSRMRHIRWEESLLRSRARQDGITDYRIHHHDCHCGSIECLGVPIRRRPLPS